MRRPEALRLTHSRHGDAEKAIAMAVAGVGTLAVLRDERSALLRLWLEEMGAAAGSGGTDEIGQQATELLQAIEAAAASGAAPADVAAAPGVRHFLEELSRRRVAQGYTSERTATFVFSIKRPLFRLLQQRLGQDADALAGEVWAATELVDGLALQTVRAYQKSREEMISRQQQELLELSTPVVKLWDGVLALPMIGTLDSARTQIVMESLLQEIVAQGAQIAIIDITGVPTVDTLVAQHLLKTVAAIRLMGADCIISGIRPQIAQTVVHLGIDLRGVTTKATLADALALALKRSGLTVSRGVAVS
jgi:rsbT co-antagonist protein RsbR